MGTGELAGIIAGSVAAPLVVAAVLGVIRWGLSADRLLGKVTELVERVGELTEAAQDTVLLRSEFTSHCRQADERWALVLGRTVPAPRAAHEGTERRRHPRVIEAGA